jgi:hypothetical protein
MPAEDKSRTISISSSDAANLTFLFRKKISIEQRRRSTNFEEIRRLARGIDCEALVDLASLIA